MLAALVVGGCSSGDSDVPEQVWGRRGISDGRFNKPRAVAIDANDRVYFVDMTARIQAFDTEGKFFIGWRTPTHDNGRPSGLSITPDGNLLVADTHYFRVLVYSPVGELLETIGGTLGHGPGEFGLVTDAVQDSQGNLYVSEYGQYDRIQKFAPDRSFVKQWGGHGSEPGQFIRPQNLAIDKDDNIWVADACNHRIQQFDSEGRLLRIWGKHGKESGDLSYPYDLVLDGEGHVYVCEFGNSRVQKFTLDGKLVDSWGHHGRKPGELNCPWGVVRDSQGKIIVLDTNNHRVQTVWF